MKQFSHYKRTVVLLLVYLISCNTYAAVESPALELEILTGDNGVSLTAGILKFLIIEGSAVNIITDTNETIDISDVPFFLNTFISGSTADGNGGYIHNSIAGTFNIDGGSLLSAALSNISLTSNAANEHSLSADLAYISGSIIPEGVSSGRIESFFTGPNAAFDINYISSGSDIFSGQVGQVSVPIPAAVWLFSSACLCFFGARTKQQAALV